MPDPLPMPSTIPEGDTKGDEKETPKTAEKGLSLSLCIVGVLKSEPDRSFVIRDLVDRTGGSYDSVKRILLRLSKTGKGAGSVRRNAHGIYQYAPEKEQDNLQALARSGNWKIENLVFVSSKVYPPLVSLSESLLGQAKGTPSDPRVPTPKAGYPITLPTGHQVSWDQYENGNQVIRISANGAPPMSPDAALLLIDRLGIDDNWKCVSLELNIDSYKHRIDSSYSLQVIEGLLLKAYQHGYNTRVEIADHRKVSLREVMDVFHDIANGVQGRQALREMDSLRKEIKEIRQDSRLALNIARKIRNREPQQCDRAGKAPKKAKPPATFTTAAELCKHSPQAAGTQGAGP